MKENFWKTNLYKLIVTLMDIVIIISSIYIAYVIQFGTELPKFNYDAFLKTYPFIILVYILFMYIFGLLDILKQSKEEIVYSILICVIMLFISTMAITFFFRAFSYPRGVMIISTALQFVFLSIWRIVVWKIKRKLYGKKKILIVGNTNAEHVARKILLKQSDIYSIKYICDSFSKNINNYIESVDIVILCDDLEIGFKNKVIDKCLIKKKELRIVPVMSDIALIGAKLNKVDDVPLLEVKSLGLTMEQKVIKRLLDLFVSIAAFIIALPIMIVVAICIKITDGGPIFYKQERVTEGGKRFYVIKFRSMIINAEKISGPVLASENDNRITKVGKIIRATRLDELPQILNIIKGDMSVVGPRPERPFYVNKFEKEISDYKYRISVKAGLTGLAQVLGKYNTKPDDKVKYDILYIKNYSILLDIKLIIQTIRIVFMKESTEGIKDEISIDKIIEDSEEEIKIDKKVE